MGNFEERDSIILENEGEKIFSVIHLPLGGQNVPAVLFCHGLAGHKIGKHRIYVSLSESLSKLGIASLRIDFRGAGDSEGQFHEMTIEGEISDAMKAFDFLCQHPKIDPERIGLLGRSFGGAIAIMVANRCGRAKSIALWAPIYNAEQWEDKWEMHETGAIDKKKREELMRINGQLPGLEFYEQLFNMDLTREIKKIRKIPMLHIHGERDPVVSINHAEHYEQVRKDAKAETKFIRLTHSDHDFSHPEEKKWAIDETCHWFKQTL